MDLDLFLKIKTSDLYNNLSLKKAKFIDMLLEYWVSNTPEAVLEILENNGKYPQKVRENKELYVNLRNKVLYYRNKFKTSKKGQSAVIAVLKSNNFFDFKDEFRKVMTEDELNSMLIVDVPCSNHATPLERSRIIEILKILKPYTYSEFQTRTSQITDEEFEGLRNILKDSNDIHYDMVSQILKGEC